jgi:multiple sugar transport system substrate-binding protein
MPDVIRSPAVRPGAPRLSRRQFLVLGCSTGSLVLLSTCGAASTKPAAQAGLGGFNGGGSLRVLMSSHFIPAYDAWFDKWAADWGAKNKVEVTVDHILGAQLAQKNAAEVAAGDGHDLINFARSGEVNLFNKSLGDVSDLARQLGQQHGGWVLPLAEQVGMVGGAWKGVPESFADVPSIYRKDLFDAAGLQVPDTWEGLLKVGEALKAKGNPIGIAINQQSIDANTSWQSVLWCYGALYVGQDGKMATVDTPEMKQAVSFALDLYRKTMTDEVLSWDDAGNNQFLASGRGAWIQNPISALRTIERDNPELAKKISIAGPPGGPSGRFASVATDAWGIMTWSKNTPAATALLSDYYAVMPEAIRASQGYNQPLLKELRKKPMPILGKDPKLQVLQDFDQLARVSGFPGPPTPASGEVDNNWLIPLMIGRAVQSGNVDEAIKWVEAKVQAIYDKYK